jgi:CheY-like chemotaxis protein
MNAAAQFRDPDSPPPPTPCLIVSPVKSSAASKTSATRARSTNRPGQTPTHRACAAHHSPGKHILLVDDDPTVRDSLNDVLVAEGYFVIPAGNGQQALNIAANARVDLVLLDLNMPIKNGWDTFEQFTREHPLIPIIIATARPNQLFTALGAGAGALLEKPMDITTLLRTMGKLLAETSEQRLARLAGKETEFHYQSASTNCESSHPLKDLWPGD